MICVLYIFGFFLSFDAGLENLLLSVQHICDNIYKSGIFCISKLLFCNKSASRNYIQNFVFVFHAGYTEIQISYVDWVVARQPKL